MIGRDAQRESMHARGAQHGGAIVGEALSHFEIRLLAGKLGFKLGDSLALPFNVFVALGDALVRIFYVFTMLGDSPMRLRHVFLKLVVSVFDFSHRLKGGLICRSGALHRRMGIRNLASKLGPSLVRPARSILRLPP